VIQSARKSATKTASYEPVRLDDSAELAAELAAAKQKLREVLRWADRGEWMETGSDRLYDILLSK
jgi:hypothetical protein